MTQFYTSDRCLDGDLVSSKYAAADASLIHFSGRVKPWLTRQDEFYNGLYRKLVLAAEERVGLGCGFYFSRQVPCEAVDWGVDRWAANLGTTQATVLPDVSPLRSDVRLVDVTDTHVYLRLTPEAYLHTLARRLRLAARTGNVELFEVPLDRLGPQQTHLSNRAGAGIRSVAVDLVSALAPCGGVARDVDLVLRSPEARFERSLGTLDVLAAGAAATSDLLGELPVEGAVEGLDGGRIRAWYRAVGDQPLSLHIAGDLVAQRAEAADEAGLRMIDFRAGHIVVGLGYGAQSGDQLSIRVPGTNVPLPGAQVTVGQVRAERAAAAVAPPLRRLRHFRTVIRSRFRRRPDS